MKETHGLSHVTDREHIEALGRRCRRWRLAALVCISVLGGVLILGQEKAPEEPDKAGDAPLETTELAPAPTWQYEVLRLPAQLPRGEDVTRYLTDELNAGVPGGWEYVGLLGLEADRGGYNGLVAFRREKR